MWVAMGSSFLMRQSATRQTEAGQKYAMSTRRSWYPMWVIFMLRLHVSSNLSSGMLWASKRKSSEIVDCEGQGDGNGILRGKMALTPRSVAIRYGELNSRKIRTCGLTAGRTSATSWRGIRLNKIGKTRQLIEMSEQQEKEIRFMNRVPTPLTLSPNESAKWRTGRNVCWLNHFWRTEAPVVLPPLCSSCDLDNIFKQNL